MRTVIATVAGAAHDPSLASEQSALRACLGAAAVLLASFAAQPFAVAGPTSSLVRQSGHWMAGCDNRGECVAIGVGPEPPRNVAWLHRHRIAIRISGEMSSQDGVRIEAFPLFQTASGPINVIATVGLGFADADRSADAKLEGGRLTLPRDKAMAWMAALFAAKELRVSVREFEAPKTDGFAHAWAWIAHQRMQIMRDAPFATSGQPPRERLRPAPEVMSSGYPAIQLLKTQCPDGSQMMGYRQFMLPGDALLWAVNCVGPKGAARHWFQSAPRLAMVEPLRLQDAEGQSIDAGKDGLPESVFDFDFGVLRARHGPNDRPDCGIQRAWGWDGREFFLLEQREMPVCAGLSASDWIRTYIAP